MYALSQINPYAVLPCPPYVSPILGYPGGQWGTVPSHPTGDTVSCACCWMCHLPYRVCHRPVTGLGSGRLGRGWNCGRALDDLALYAGCKLLEGLLAPELSVKKSQHLGTSDSKLCISPPVQPVVGGNCPL